MSRRVAFLRGINLGNRRLTNDELATHVESAGLRNVATYQASGNVVYDATGEAAVEEESLIETHLADALGYPVDTYVRALDALRPIAEMAALEAAEADGFRPHVVFLKAPVDDEAAAALGALETPDDGFRVLGREVVWLRRGRLSDAAIGTRELESALGPKQTMRTLGTVRRIVAKFGG